MKHSIHYVFAMRFGRKPHANKVGKSEDFMNFTSCIRMSAQPHAQPHKSPSLPANN